MVSLIETESKKGLIFVLPEGVQDKDVSVIEVGPYHESGRAKEINKFLRTEIQQLNRVDTYVLVHSPDVKGLEALLSRRPFVDPIIHRAALNEPLALQLGLSFDYILQSMLNPGTSDAWGDTALRQALLALGREFREGDIGFYSSQHFLKGDVSKEKLEEISAFLANPELNTRLIIPRKDYESSLKVQAPIVVLKPDIIVKEYDVLNMSGEELAKLSSTRKLAATLEEMQQFRDMYKNPEFMQKRRAVGLSEKATDVELEVWFGLRSEHCFHKELNARIILEDRVNDPIFARAFEKGWLTRNNEGDLLEEDYLLEKGMFKKFIEEPAKLIFDRLEKRGKNWIADMFKDNAGTVYYDEDFMFCIKFETHNSPSNKEPVQGAKTGIDGVERDGFGNMMGTFDVIAHFFLYCTGDPRYKGWLPKGVKHPYMLLKGITQGVREGGNEMQVPTLNGGLITDPRFIAKILVYCGIVGWSPVRPAIINLPEYIEKTKAAALIGDTTYLGKHPRVGDLVFVAGQPVGRDGIHGATESSLSASAYISLGHVQADFSFIQAKMKEWILECARGNLFTSIGDCGAMGIGVTLELGKDTNGLELDLAKHPRKYAGIQPWEVACSETQDRMVPIISPENKDEILKRAKLHDVQVTELGKLTDSGYAHLKWEDRSVALIDLEKLDNKEPRKQMYAQWNGTGKQDAPQIKGKYSLEESLCMVMEQPDVASKEWFFRQKDSSVKGTTIQGPLIGLKQEVEADATIQKPLETEGRDHGAIAYSFGISPKLSDIDAYNSAQKSFVDMVGKIIAVGGALPDMENPKWDAWAVCGNYCQPNSEAKSTLTQESGAHNLASLLREAIAIREAEEELNIPLISGKDSMKCSCVYEVDDSFKLEEVPADLRKHIAVGEKEVTVKDKETGEERKEMRKHIEIHDPDSYLASCAVKIEDYRKCVNSALKQEGDLIYVIGTTKNHLGASQYLSAVGYKEQGAPIEGGFAPEVDFEEFREVANAVNRAIEQETVASCSYVHNGGLAAALAKAAIAGEKGASIFPDFLDYQSRFESTEQILYSETPGRFIVTVAPKDKDAFEEALGLVPHKNIGNVTNNQTIDVHYFNNPTQSVLLSKVKEAYQKPLSFGLNDLA